MKSYTFKIFIDVLYENRVLFNYRKRYVYKIDSSRLADALFNMMDDITHNIDLNYVNEPYDDICIGVSSYQYEEIQGDMSWLRRVIKNDGDLSKRYWY